MTHILTIVKTNVERRAVRKSGRFNSSMDGADSPMLSRDPSEVFCRCHQGERVQKGGVRIEKAFGCG